MSHTSKDVVITGAAGALGRAVCRAFLAQGYTVHAGYLRDEELADLPPELVEADHLSWRRLNLTHEHEVTAWFGGLPSVDVLVNVAGGFAMSTIADTSLGQWEHMLDMNLKSTFLCCREALAHMSRRGTGRIVNVGAYAATKRLAGMGPYTLSKAGVLHMTEVLAEETLTQDITVNAVLPTIMDTPGNRAAMPDADFSTWVPVDAVAETIVWLARPEAGAITGALIPVRGRC